jgi:heterodisulfide reductase subunit A-like polyferredoxin
MKRRSPTPTRCIEPNTLFPFVLLNLQRDRNLVSLSRAVMTMRADILRQLGEEAEPWDVLVIGGGATGLGAAVEAASRGYRTLLVERFDSAKGSLK